MSWTLVTGGAQRLGAEISLGLAAKGHSILVHYNKSKEEAKNVVKACRGYGVQAEIIQGDFSSINSTERFIEDCLLQYPSISHLINNVGNYLIKSAMQTTIEEWTSLFQSNLHAPFMLSKAFIPSIKQHQGCIVNIGCSGIGNMHADIRRTCYKITKISLYMLTKSLARELAPFNVRVNMVSPGYLENSIDLPEKMPEHSMQRPGNLQEIVHAIAFLLAEESRYITGQNIEVAGAVGL